MNKLLLILCASVMLSGCFSVMRIPYKEGTVVYDKEGNIVEDNREWKHIPTFPMSAFPTIHLRYDLLRMAWHEAPEEYKWRRYCGPCAHLVSYIGLPGDLLVDIIALPWDIPNSKDVKCPMCDAIDNGY